MLIALATSFFPLLAQTAETPKRNLLFIGQAKGYQHEATSTAMATLYNLGRSSGLWNTQLRTDCTAITKKPLKWEAKNLDAFDAIVFSPTATSTWTRHRNQTCSPLSAMMARVSLAFTAPPSHSPAGPSLGSCSAAISMVIRGDNSTQPLVVEDSTFPGMRNFPATFTLFDEIYQIKDFSRQNVRVLLTLDAGKLDLSRKGVKRADKDFAVIWARNYGKGRVLYNGLGHVPALWERPDFQKMWLEMLQWSMGLIPGDATHARNRRNEPRLRAGTNDLRHLGGSY